MAGSCAEAGRPSGEVELTAACRWNARSSLNPAAGRYVKAAAAPSLVGEEQWRQLRVRRLAWGVPVRRRQREAVNVAEKS